MFLGINQCTNIKNNEKAVQPTEAKYKQVSSKKNKKSDTIKIPIQKIKNKESNQNSQSLKSHQSKTDDIPPALVFVNSDGEITY